MTSSITWTHHPCLDSSKDKLKVAASEISKAIPSPLAFWSTDSLFINAFSGNA